MQLIFHLSLKASRFHLFPCLVLCLAQVFLKPLARGIGDKNSLKCLNRMMYGRERAVVSKMQSQGAETFS